MTDDHTALKSRLERSLDDVHAPASLGAAVLDGGHRLRRRRRALTGAGGLAAAAVVAALVVPGLGSGSGAARGVDPADQAPTPTPSARTVPVPAPPASDGAPRGWYDMPGAEIRDRLAAALPEGVTISEVAPSDRDPSDPDRGALGGLLSDGSGAATFQVMTGRYGATAVERQGFSCDDAAFTGMGDDVFRPSVCRSWDDADGRPLGRVVVYLPDPATEPDGTTIREVKVAHGDGYVYLLSTNTDAPKMDTSTPRTTARPSLTVEQMRAVASDGSWTTWTPPAD